MTKEEFYVEQYPFLVAKMDKALKELGCMRWGKAYGTLLDALREDEEAYLQKVTEEEPEAAERLG